LLLSRLFENRQLAVGDIFELSIQNSHKVTNVLRLNVNQQVILFNNTNYQFTASINKIKSKQVQVKVSDTKYANLESPLKIHLVQAIATQQKMDFIIQKATELGVYKITPIITKKSKVKFKYLENQQQKAKHWEAIAIAACCQSGRNMLPVINQPIDFDDFLVDLLNIESSNMNSIDFNYHVCKLILSPNLYPNNSIKNWRNIELNQEIVLLVGSESGFTTEEEYSAIKKNFLVLNLGPRILRTETAPIAAISIFQAKYGDLLLE
jgi:16S rRNA (uracil1498-N3)-methyltransferase